MEKIIENRKLAYSIVIPIFNEEGNLRELYEKLMSVMSSFNEPFELVFIDDGSHDRSVAIIKELMKENHRLCLVSLSRNFGHQVAISAGIDYAKGESVVLMDADLQDPPEVIPSLIEKLNEGYDVVYAVRKKRKEGIILRSCFALYYRILRKVSYVDIPLDAGDFCIMNRRVVELLQNMKEKNRFVRAIRSWLGFRQTGVEYERKMRKTGDTKYSFNNRLRGALDGIISFSYIPLKIATLLGFISSIVSFLAICMFLIAKLFFNTFMVRGFPTTIIIILFLGGIQLITIGIIGEYIGRIYDEVKQRPLYVVKELVRSESSSENS